MTNAGNGSSATTTSLCSSRQVTVDIALKVRGDRGDRLVLCHRRNGLDLPDIAHQRETHHLRRDEPATDEAVPLVAAKLGDTHQAALDYAPQLLAGRRFVRSRLQDGAQRRPDLVVSPARPEQLHQGLAEILNRCGPDL